MRNALTIAGFEIRTRLKRISTWVYFAVFFALAMLWAAAAGGAIPHAIIAFGSGKIWINSPYAIAQTVSFLGMVGLTVIAAIMGRAVQQDFEYRVEDFFFSAPIRKWEYLSGRFAGAIVVLVIVLSGIALGGIASLLLPGLDPDRVGPVRPLAYILPYFTVLLPNLFVLGGIFFWKTAALFSCARQGTHLEVRSVAFLHLNIHIGAEKTCVRSRVNVKLHSFVLPSTLLRRPMNRTTHIKPIPAPSLAARGADSRVCIGGFEQRTLAKADVATTK